MTETAARTTFLFECIISLFPNLSASESNRKQRPATTFAPQARIPGTVLGMEPPSGRGPQKVREEVAAPMPILAVGFSLDARRALHAPLR
jgi:hypothetical protein